VQPVGVLDARDRVGDGLHSLMMVDGSMLQSGTPLHFTVRFRAVAVVVAQPVGVLDARDGVGDSLRDS
jgi:hypothetical protein